MPTCPRLKFVSKELGWVEMEFPNKRISPKQTYKVSGADKRVFGRTKELLSHKSLFTISCCNIE